MHPTGGLLIDFEFDIMAANARGPLPLPDTPCLACRAGEPHFPCLDVQDVRDFDTHYLSPSGTLTMVFSTIHSLVGATKSHVSMWKWNFVGLLFIS